MVKNYATIFLSVLLCATGLLNPCFLGAQEPKVFKVSDFDLKGTVKTCLVITDYGKEEYNFNRDGFLTKSVTRYNHSDYEITQYKYNAENLLIEKRIENYRDEAIDKQTSIVHVYKIDTTRNKLITEKIVSYNKEFLGEYTYSFNDAEKIIGIKKVDNDGIDETTINYTNYKGETTVKYLLNGVIKKSIRTSKKKTLDNKEERILLTKRFLDGNPYEAIEETFDSENKLRSRVLFMDNTDGKGFVKDETRNYFYDDKDFLAKIKIDHAGFKVEEEYIYQFDENENWIKEIITPDNTYKTRKIKYYEVVAEEEE